MALAAHQLVGVREVRRRPTEADALAELLAELADLARLSPAIVLADMQNLFRSLQERRKTCHGCATETIGRRRPKRSQRVFCSEECSQAARDADFRERKRRALQGAHG